MQAAVYLKSPSFSADALLEARDSKFKHGGTACYLEVTMKTTGKPRKHRFLKAELAVLVVCLACFWAFKSGAIDIDGVKAAVLRQVVKIAPDNIDAHRLLADYYDDSDRYEEARRTYKEVVRMPEDTIVGNLKNTLQPENIIRDNLSDALQRAHEKYELQWNGVVRRANTVGERRAIELLSDIEMRMTHEVSQIRQRAQHQLDQLAQVDQLAQLNPSINANEVKWRMVLGPEAEAGMFPREKRPRSFGSPDR